MENLFELTAYAKHIDQLLEDNGGELTEAMEAELGENSASIARTVDNYNEVLRKAEMMNLAIDDEIKRLQALKKSNESKAKGVKNYLKYIMSTFGISKIEGQFCKVSLRKSKAVDVVDELLFRDLMPSIAEMRKALPNWCVLEVKANKTALKAELESGKLIMGAVIIENENVIIK